MCSYGGLVTREWYCSVSMYWNFRYFVKISLWLVSNHSHWGLVLKYQVLFRVNRRYNHLQWRKDYTSLESNFSQIKSKLLGVSWSTGWLSNFSKLIGVNWSGRVARLKLHNGWLKWRPKHLIINGYEFMKLLSTRP